MAKRLFSERPVGAVTLVETPVSRSYAQKARVAFLVVAASVALVVAATASVALPLVLAVVVGLLSGAVCGLVVACLVRVWPALRVLDRAGHPGGGVGAALARPLPRLG